MSAPSAKVIADSISPTGVRLTTIEETFHRFVLAERNTHTAQSKNSASSRARPLEKVLDDFLDHPALPLSWPAEQPGMQGGAELEGKNLLDAQDLWSNLRSDIGNRIVDYITAHPDKSTRLHKSVLNRPLEFAIEHTCLSTATAWENYFELRCDEDAQPEIRAVALAAREAYRNSTPRELREGEWHLPYIESEDWAALSKRTELGRSMYPEMVKISAARCARVSYLTQSGKRDLAEDIRLYDRLITERSTTGKPLHWSPLQHVATPWPLNHLRMGLPFTTIDGTPAVTQADVPYIGNLLGWRSLRTEVEVMMGVNTFR